MKTPTNKTVLSGIQPSGAIHLGNYLGALKQWVELQEHNTVYYCLVDLHAITVAYEPNALLERVLDAAALLLAIGIDPSKSTLFLQSHVPAHTELNWLLATITAFGELERMTQFKDKQSKQRGQASLGLFAYPVLQAADILLYQADVVPIGEDQIQHLELVRDIAKRFNNKFGAAFTVPAAFVPEKTARVMSLTDPTKKMSKSDTAKSYIGLTDEPDVIRKKITSAVTETEPIFSYTESGSAVKNLLHIFTSLSGETPAAMEQRFAGANYRTFKEALADLLIAHLTPIKSRYDEFRGDEKSLQKILTAGGEQARQTADKTLADVKQKMGLRI